MFLREDWEKEEFIDCECLSDDCPYYDKYNHYCKFMETDLYEVWNELPCDRSYNYFIELEED